MSPSHPSAHQWELFEVYASFPVSLTPHQFLQHWSVNYREMSYLTGASRNTVERWFLHSAARRVPAPHYCRRMAEIDVLWQKASLLTVVDLQQWRGVDPVI